MTPGSPVTPARPPGVEWLCLRESLRFARRHRRYFFIFLVLYWHSLWHWKSARAARYGYCFLQLFDDIMDGDRITPIAPETIAAQIIAQWQTATFARDTTLSRLAAALHAALKSLPLLPGDDPHHDVLTLLHIMQRDARRVAARNMLLPQADLKNHLHTTFHHSTNLFLIAARVKTRAAQVPDLVAALCWCSVVRDWDEDLARGLINIPAEVAQPLEAAGEKLTATHPQIQAWREAERARAVTHLQASAVTLAALATTDPPAARLLKSFQRSIERYAKMTNVE